MLSVESLKAAARRSAEYSQKQYRLFGWVCLIAMPLSAFVEQIVASPSYNTIWIRASAGLVGALLLLESRVTKNLRDHFYIVWITVITYVLPFTFGVMLVLNAAYAAEGETISQIWIFQYLVSILFFVNLVHSESLSTTLWIVSASLSALTLTLVDGPNWESVTDAVVLVLPVYLTAVLVGSLTNRNVAMVQREKLRAASAIGANLAHELRTPLASISALSKGAGNLLPILTDAYEKAKEAGIEVGKLRKNQVEILSNTLGTIRNEVEYSNTIIDMLLVNTADKSLSDVEMDVFSVREAAEEAVRRYPFNNQRERDLIRVEIAEDFELKAPRLLVIHILFNLMKNALYFVQQARKGSISIRAEQDAGYWRIMVHDTGSGIPASVKPHIFERFYTTTNTGQGAGIGLSFCKLVMESIGGSIRCDSEEGEFATFTLEFPKVRD